MQGQGPDPVSPAKGVFHFRQENEAPRRFVEAGNEEPVVLPGVTVKDGTRGVAAEAVCLEPLLFQEVFRLFLFPRDDADHEIMDFPGKALCFVTSVFAPGGFYMSSYTVKGTRSSMGRKKRERFFLNAGEFRE